MENFPHREKGKARDKAGAKVGVSGRSVEKAAKVKENTPDLYDDMKEGQVSLDAAYKEARKIEKSKQAIPNAEKPPKSEVSKKNGFVKLDQPKQEMVKIITVDGKEKEIPKPKRTQFNKTNDSVDWARWTWNPVTGCLHGCSFCYAREIANSQRMANLYPFKFEPAFHEYRLDAPKNTERPESDDPRDGRVFVCSMADLFGKWVPKEWVKKVFDVCLESPEWEYLFLTKWPAKYAQLPLIEKAWYGASIVTQDDVKRIEKAMQNFEAENAIKWVSMEPMLSPIEFNDLSWCDLVVIGSQTSTNQPEGYQPEIPANFDAVVDVVNQCRDWGIPYYLKANMGLDRPGMSLPKMKPRIKQTTN